MHCCILTMHKLSLRKSGYPIPKQFYSTFLRITINVRKYHHKQRYYHTRKNVQEKLYDHCIQSSYCLFLPSLSTNKCKTLAGHMELLLQCPLKYKERLYKDRKAIFLMIMIDDEYIVQLYQFSIVRLLYRQYRLSNHKAGTWRKCFSKDLNSVKLRDPFLSHLPYSKP